MSEQPPIVVVIGLDIEKKPHASRFQEEDRATVQRAAELMGLHVIQIGPENQDLYTTAGSLPLGKIYATGKAFVPFVNRVTFDKLGVLVEGGITIQQRAESGAEPVFPLADMFTTEAISTADALWAKIEVGTQVLASQTAIYGPGWWEGLVVAVDGDDLMVRWMDEPAEDPIRVQRRHVALRHPGVD
jgi:hypothetical protein